jgi:hypothetical protein
LYFARPPRGSRADYSQTWKDDLNPVKLIKIVPRLLPLALWLFFVSALGAKWAELGTENFFLWAFNAPVHAHFTLAPSHREPFEAVEKTPLRSYQNLDLAVYDGSYTHDGGIALGGDHFLHAASLPYFELRVNGRDSDSAAEAVERRLAERGAQDSATFANVWVIDHGDRATPMMNGSVLGDNFYNFVSKHRPEGDLPNLYFLECRVAEGDDGKRFIQGLADHYHIRVYASERDVEWHVWRKLWRTIPADERNFNFTVGDWFVATPGGGTPQRLREAPPLP